MSRKINRVGETNISFYGQKMTIIAYRNNKDLDVMFEDGTIVTNKVYDKFKSGNISNPNFYKNQRLGEIGVSACGLRMKIIEYNSNEDISVQFEDGTIVRHKAYGDFKRGHIGNPNVVSKEQISCLGLVGKSSKGDKMKIIAWRSSADIDVEFEDGTVVQHKTYNNFINGLIFNPSHSANKYIGMTAVHKRTGLKMRIIGFRNRTDIDVEFEDGTKVYNKSLQNFKDGKMGYPINIKLGEVRIVNNGLKAKVISYKDASHISVQFEDGTVVDTTYHSFTRGTVGHPSIKLVRGDYFSRTSRLYGFKVIKLAYQYNGVSYYICECEKCGYHDILSIQEMKYHNSQEL